MKKKLILTDSQYSSLKNVVLEMRLRTYIFDWDDNILYMPTTIKMDKQQGDEWVPVDVSTDEYTKARTNPNYRFRNDDTGEAFVDFKDTKSFIEDTKKAIHQGQFGPSFDKFKEALIHANGFAINTARGHKPEALKMGVKLFIDMVLTNDEKSLLVSNVRNTLKLSEGLTDEQTIDLYLDEMGEYYPVSSEEFGERFGLDVSGGASSPEHAKKVAIEHFVNKVITSVKALVDNDTYSKVSVGFSDDDLKNVKAAEEFIDQELQRIYPELHFVVYDTSDRGKKKVVIEKSYD